MTRTPTSAILSSSASCPAPSRLDAYFDHELPDVESEAIEAHLADCVRCRHSLEQIESASNLVKSIELPELSQMSRARVMRDLAGSAAGRDRWLLSVRLLTAAAAAIFLLATGLIFYQLHNASAPGAPEHVLPIGIHQQTPPGAAPIVPTGSSQP